MTLTEEKYSDATAVLLSSINDVCAAAAHDEELDGGQTFSTLMAISLTIISQLATKVREMDALTEKHLALDLLRQAITEGFGNES